ncbi:methyltransferase domain-containing protein [Marinoscillum sp. MHG1-6]|uniref:methyltransferase domain-containing protein n=1 Tax=Marinoscillum sp. MHG1-6 TaxID=2959627 RepID=UPI0021572F27|nr:methyltransferase domain-containing protein [Marinoscillum sp. MHG1-6]
MDLSDRSYELEIMDDFDIDGPAIDQTLRELDIINRTLGGNKISLDCFRKIIKNHSISSLADLGCGSGDLMKSMSKIARDKHIQYIGYDANPYIVKYAEDHTREIPNISCRSENIFSPEFAKEKFDVIHCCLFLHHFTQQELISLFKNFKSQANVAIIVNDLHRHWLAYQLIKLITRMFSKSYLVRNDAALSVARGFKKVELEEILRAAGIQNYELKWRWAFRWQLLIHTRGTLITNWSKGVFNFI